MLRLSLIESKIEQRTRERERKTRRELADLLVELEAEYTELPGLLQGLEAILCRNRATLLSKYPFKFGSYKPLYAHEDFTTYIETLLAINRKAGQLIELTSKIVKQLYVYEVRIPPRLLEELIKFRVDLNLIFKGQPNYQDAFRSYYEIISKGDFLIRELKKSL